MGDQHRQRLALRQVLQAAVGVDLVPDTVMLSGAVQKLDRTSWDRLGALIDAHGLTMQVAKALRPLTDVAPATFVSDLQTRVLRHRANHLRIRVALEGVAEALETRVPEYVVLKGPALAATAYSDPTVRTYSDIDILVAPGNASRALETLEGIGGQLMTRNWTLVQEWARSEIQVAMPNGIVVDLHWSPSGRGGSGDAAETRSLLARRRHATMHGITFPTLSSPDQVIHTCLHALRSGFGPARFAVDIDQSLRSLDGRPRALVDLARSAGAELAVTVAIHRSRSAFTSSTRPGTRPLPAFPGATTAWASLLAMLDAVNPPTATHERSPFHILMRSTGQSTGQSLHNLMQNVWERVGQEGSLANVVSAAHASITVRSKNRESQLLEIAGSRSEYLESLREN